MLVSTHKMKMSLAFFVYYCKLNLIHGIYLYPSMFIPRCSFINDVLFPLQSCLCTCHSKHIGGYLFCVSILHKKTEIIFLLSNAHIFILIWILFTIAVQPVYVPIMLTHHVVLMLIDVKGKYCNIWPACTSRYTCILIFQFFYHYSEGCMCGSAPVCAQGMADILGDTCQRWESILLEKTEIIYPSL